MNDQTSPLPPNSLTANLLRKALLLGPVGVAVGLAMASPAGADDVQAAACGQKVPKNEVEIMHMEIDLELSLLQTVKLKQIAESVRLKTMDNPDEAEQQQRQVRALNEAVREQEDKLKQKRKALSDMASTKGIIHIGANQIDWTPKEAIKRAIGSQDYLDALRDFEQELENLETIKLKEISESIRLKVMDNPDEAKQQERQLRALNDAVREQENKVREKRLVLATILRTKTTIYKGAAPRDAAREEAIRRALYSQEYVDAKLDFQQEQEILQTMKLKQTAEITRGKAIKNPDEAKEHERLLRTMNEAVRVQAEKVVQKRKVLSDIVLAKDIINNGATFGDETPQEAIKQGPGTRE